MKPIPVFVGYDPREAIAYHVCANSIIRNASAPVAIIPIALNLFQDYQETHTDGSNHFIYTRFLVPHLMDFKGRAIFIDGDMVVRGDIVELYNLLRQGMDVAVVKHDYKTRMPVKYLGSKNEDYPRKNWSSVIVWDCQSYPNRKLTPEFVQNQPGSFLHRFSWLEDDRIQALPPEWNWLPDEYDPNPNAKLLHYTLGTPCFHEFAGTPQAEEWHREKMYVDYCQQRNFLGPEPVPVKQPVEIKDLSFPKKHKEFFQEVARWVEDPDGDYADIKDRVWIDSWLDTAHENQLVGLSEMDDVTQKQQDKGSGNIDGIVQSFARGTGGRVGVWSKYEESTAPVALRSIAKKKVMRRCEEQGRDYYYIDTGYFGNQKHKSYHRITKNAMQWLGEIEDRPADRLERTGVRARKMTKGSKILLCPPSQKAMSFWDLEVEKWVEDTVAEIKKLTDRPIEIRMKQSRSVRQHVDTMEMALARDVHCLVTFNSIAAVEALILGKPVFTMGPNAAHHLANSDLSLIDDPFRPNLDEVNALLRCLSYHQFTVEEMKNGYAWAVINGEA